MPPNKRRTMSCQHCRRLKTRCEAVVGSRRCLRCQKLRLVKAQVIDVGSLFLLLPLFLQLVQKLNVHHQRLECSLPYASWVQQQKVEYRTEAPLPCLEGQENDVDNIAAGPGILPNSGCSCHQRQISSYSYSSTDGTWRLWV